MIKEHHGEKWKAIQFDFEFINDCRIEVSNLGRVRTFNKISNGNIITGSLTEGYRIIRLKLYKPRPEKVQKHLDAQKRKSFKMARDVKALKLNKEPASVIKLATKELELFNKNLSKKFAAELQSRAINYHSLIHRLVADYFLKPPKAGQTIVAHLDHDKLNNKASNLKWMTPEENYEHQRSSPHVIKEKSERKNKIQAGSKVAKLTVTKVMLLKKLLNQDKPMKQLVKIFKVTDTQILRIKRGENWTDIEAAK